MDIQTIVSWFKDSPEGRAVAKHQEESLLNQRKEWAETVRKAEEEHKRVSAPLFADENKARENLEDTKKRAADMIAKAERDYREAQSERWKVDSARDRVLGPALAGLRATPSPKIDESRRKLELRRSQLHVEREWPPNGRQPTHSTYASMQAQANRINQIIVHELAKVALEALSDEELDARLQELEESIPAIVMAPIG